MSGVGLDFLAGDPPEPGEGGYRDITEHVRWMAMPMPGSLQAINLYLLRDDDGWTVVDTGLYSPDTMEGWRRAKPLALEGAPLHRVVCTHMHVDHAGMAGMLVAAHGARLWMSALEYYSARMISDGERPQDHTELSAFMARAGLEPSVIDKVIGQRQWMTGLMSPVPSSFNAIRDGDRITVGERSWQVIEGRGHSPCHCCLWNEEDGLLLSGDQILPAISSNVSVTYLEPEGNPLADWLASLARIRELVPDNVLVLPAHGLPFRGLHERIGQLLAHHEAAMERLLSALSAPKRGCDLFEAAFARTVPPSQAALAVGEVLAHLACLRSRGQVLSERGDDGVERWWQR